MPKKNGREKCKKLEQVAQVCRELAAVCPELVAMCRELAARSCAASSRQERVCRELAAVCRKLAARACTASSRQCAASSRQCAASSRQYAASSRPCLPLARGLCHNLEAPLSFSSQAEPKFHSAGATCQYRAPLKITPYKYPATTQ